ncbi:MULTISPECIES: c-type cytochrome [Roseobacteraceae]|uniref:C-type cytochrome n=1 Tax=Tropicimonas aquimaris TaxID=914152 RepID=A0ABW3IJU9_9RHOB|nr:c-type cytochrome [Aliiruegeria sabulilitoris]NDR56640.1 cytochrome c [Pseudoruegeria sp. M32A2M]
MKGHFFSILVCIVGGAVQTTADEVPADGGMLFEKHCARCHGTDGTGNGNASGNLNTRPPDLTKIAARRDGVWPMLEVMSIVDGYTKQTTPREEMPLISALTDGPVVEFDTGNGLFTEVPARLIAVANYLESIQSPKPERYVP